MTFNILIDGFSGADTGSEEMGAPGVLVPAPKNFFAYLRQFRELFKEFGKNSPIPPPLPIRYCLLV